MNTQNTKRLSKFLSLLLRHKPETIGLTLDENGWADVDDLLSKMNSNGKNVTLDQVKAVVKDNDKQRFKLDLENNRIRANQGHSLKVDVELKASTPPEFLYHGTAERNIQSIQSTGLDKRNRQHVHLSENKDTAINVGSRYGKPVVLLIDAKKMTEEGFDFFLS